SRGAGVSNDQGGAGRGAVTPVDGGAGEVGGAGPRVGVGEGGHRHRACARALGGGEPGAVARCQRRVVHRGRVGGAGRRPAVVDDARGGGVRALVVLGARTLLARGAAASRDRGGAGRAAVTPVDGGAGEVGRDGPRVGVGE